MYYLQSRYYDPELGRFINADNYPYTGQGLTGNNMFAYCGNNPVSRSDGGGCFWDTVFDVVSLVASIVDVVQNPKDVGAWIGLAMDIVDVAIPCIGGLGEIVDAVNVARKTSSKVGNAIDAARAVDNAADMADNMYDAGKAFDGALCFVAGTMVLTGKGHAAIETIQPGDQVWALDECTGDIALKKVVETYINETDEIIHLFVNGEQILATPAHPFYSPVKGWMDAVQLRAGDILVLVNGEYVVVEKVQHEILETPVEVYNFQVEDYHTYYVGNSGVLVHNSCGMPENFSPAGAGRHGAFNQAKRDLGIPSGKQPTVLPNIDKRGNLAPGRVYDFDGIQIRDDVAGHSFSDGGYLPRHFNTPDGRHYFY